MKTFKKVAKATVDVFTIMLLILLALVIYGKATSMSKNAYPNYFGYTFFEVASGSMEPTLHLNDVIVVKITKNNLNKGDIIAFSQDEAIITHRIVYMDGQVLTVKGDNNNTIDKPILIDNVIGKVIKICPHLGIWKRVLTEPKILLLIFVTLLLFDFALSYDGKKMKPNFKELVKKDIKQEKEVKTDEKVVKEEDNEIKTKEKDDEIKNEEKVVVEIASAKDLLAKEVDDSSESKDKEQEELLSLTRKIDVDEISKLLEETEKDEFLPKEKLEEKEEIIPKEKKDKKNIDYTVRLDLNEIHKKIDERMR